MKYIIAILVIIVVLHEISLWRLNHKVEVLTEFFDKTIQKLKEYTTEQTEEDEGQDLEPLTKCNICYHDEYCDIHDPSHDFCQFEPQTETCIGCKFKSGPFCTVDGDCKYFNRYEPQTERSE